MNRSRWLLSDEIVHRYNVSEDALFVYDSKTNQEHSIRHNGSIYYDVSHLVDAHNKRLETINKSHELYYKLSETLTDSQMSAKLEAHSGKAKSAWLNFLCYGMFKYVEHSIFAIDMKYTRFIDFNRWAEDYLTYNEPQVSDFDSVEDYYGFYEARRLYEAI